MRSGARAVGLPILAMGAAIFPVEASGTVIAERLDNGLRIVVREHPSAPVVAVSLVVLGGARSEPEDLAGITSLLQHVLLKGTGMRSALEVAEAAERLGGGLAVSAEADVAEIRGTALARHWREILGLLAEIALHPALPPHEIEVEREVLISRIRSRQDRAFTLGLDTLAAMLFGRHAYGRPPGGTVETLRRVDQVALGAHYRHLYRADRMVVSVSGDVAGREVLAVAARLFGGIQPRADGEASVAPPPGLSPGTDRVVVLHRAAQAQVLAGFLVPPPGHPDYAAARVLGVALGGGMAGRLFRELRDREGLAYATGTVYLPRVESGLLVAHIGTAPERADRAEDGLRRQVERLLRESLGASEVERAKAYLLGQFALDRRTNARLAWHQAVFEATGLGHDFLEAFPRAVARVTAEDVHRVARTYLASPAVVRLEPPGR